MDFDLEQLLQGDEREWQVFTHRVTPVIYSAARKILETRHGHAQPGDIYEIVQEVFMILVKDDYRTLRSFCPERARITTWLTVIAMRRAVKYADQLKKAPQPADVSRYGESAHAPDTPACDIEIPEKLLTPRQRLVMKMFYDRDMSVEEISRVLNISAQSVRSTRHKALQRLRKYFKAQSIMTFILVILDLRKFYRGRKVKR